MFEHKLSTYLRNGQAHDATCGPLPATPLSFGATVADRLSALIGAKPTYPPDVVALINAGCRGTRLRRAIRDRLSGTGNVILLLWLLDQKLRPELRFSAGRLIERVFWAEFSGFLVSPELMGRLAAPDTPATSTLVSEIDGLRSGILDAATLPEAFGAHDRLCARLAHDGTGPVLPVDYLELARLFAANFVLQRAARHDLMIAHEERASGEPVTSAVARLGRRGDLQSLRLLDAGASAAGAPR